MMDQIEIFKEIRTAALEAREILQKAEDKLKDADVVLFKRLPLYSAISYLDFVFEVHYESQGFLRDEDRVFAIEKVSEEMGGQFRPILESIQAALDEGVEK